jgi:hypothetical protein
MFPGQNENYMKMVEFFNSELRTSETGQQYFRFKYESTIIAIVINDSMMSCDRMNISPEK